MRGKRITMMMLTNNLRTAFKRAGHLSLVCGFLLTSGLFAQNYSSSSNNQYNGQYNNGVAYKNGQYNNQNGPYNNQRTPRYTGNSWADHFVLEGGGGGTAAAGGTQDYANPGFNVLLGAGLRFNNRLSLLAEWNFNRMGVPHSLASVVAGVPDGNEHIWTVDLNPKFNVIRMGRTDMYVIGGGGFSRALTNFTYPIYVPCFGYGYGYGYGCTGDVTVARTSSNQANVDIGIGGEWRVSPYERGSIFVEARYLKLFSPNNGLPPGYNAALVPVTVGYRW